MRRSTWCVRISLAVVLGVCSAGQSGTIRDDVNPQAYLDLGVSSTFAAVGRVDGATRSSHYLASGTLIAPDWVLTAAHVVKGATSLSFTLGGTTYSATSWVANSNFNSGNLGAGNDIGLIHLGSPVSGVAPATLYTGSAEMNAIGTSVGYGMTGTGVTGYVVDWSNIQKRAGQNTVDAFYPVRRGTPNVILMDFDRPGVPAESSYGSAVPLDLEYLIAPGDSGGGLFAEFGGITQLIGVHSFGWGKLDGNPDSDYGDVSGDTRVSVFNSWISGAMTGGIGGKGGGGKGSKAAGATDVVLGDYEYGALDGVAAVPEPATLSLLVLGGLMIRRRRK